MGLAYQSQADAFMRLNNTVCMYKGLPVYVQVDRENQEVVHVQPLLGTKPTVVKYTEDVFDYKPRPLGYMNISRTAPYLTRIPERNQKQGLDRHSIQVYSQQDYNPNWMISENFHNCIMGIYPTLQKAKEEFNDERTSLVAFSRRCALGRGNLLSHELYFRGKLVGYLNKKDDKLTMIPLAGDHLMKRVLKGEGINV